jgi:hypothetical protein
MQLLLDHRPWSRAANVDIHAAQITLLFVLGYAGRIVTIFALCCAIGLHWIALQSVAWTTMLVEYSKCAPLRQAVAQTFDGSHPCSLCHAVSTAKHSEKKSDLQTPTAKLDMICVAPKIGLIPPLVRFEYATCIFSLSDHGNSPPVPPPRILSRRVV